LLPSSEEYQVPQPALHFILGKAPAFCSQEADALNELKDLLETSQETWAKAEWRTWIRAAGQSSATCLRHSVLQVSGLQSGKPTRSGSLEGKGMCDNLFGLVIRGKF